MANELSNPNSYVTVSGLSEFLTQIKSKYAANTSTSYAVNHAAEAGKLATARTISFATGDVTGSFSFDGSANVSDVALSIGTGKVTNAMLAGSIEQSKISGLGDALDAKLDDTQLVAAFQATPDDTHIASEKLVKDSLDGKVDVVAGKGLSTEDYTTADKTKVAGIAAGAQVNVLEGVQVNSTDLTIDTNKKVNVTVVEGSTDGTIAVNGVDVSVHGLAAAAYAAIANNCTTTTEGSVLDATQGKALADRISALEGVGRFLSTWNMETGLPGDDPAESPYAYKAGDYYIVNVVPATGDKLKPEGTSYTKGVASTAKETGTVALGDFYFYTKTGWQLVHYDAREVTFTQIAGDARDNSSIAGYLDGKLGAAATVNSKAFSDDAVTIDGGDILATGYAKAAAKAAIAATDDLNAALGKLEYKVDNIVGSEVTLTGYTKATEAAAIAATDKVDAALGKLEYKLDTDIAALTTHAADTDIHVTAAKQTAWNAKYDKPATGIPSTDMTEAVQASLTLADSAVQSVAEGSTNGTIAVDGADVAVHGLGTAAYKADTYFVAAESGKRLMTDAEGTKLGGIAEGAQVNIIEGVKLSDSTSVITPDTNKIVTIPNATTSADGLMSSEDKTKIDGMQAGATKVEASLTNGNIKINGTETTVYTHPSYTAKAADLYVMTVDATGHVSAATAAAYSDLPITKSDLDGTIGVASASANGLMSSTDYSKLAGLVAATTADIDSIFA